MRFFRDLSLGWKLRIVTTLTATVAVGLACSAFYVFDSRTFRDRLVSETASLADVLASNSAGALVFEDEASAAATLAGIAAAGQIRHADLYRPDGTRLAHWRREPAAEPEAAGVSGLLKDSHAFGEHELILSRRVMHDGEQVGSLVVEAGLQGLDQRREEILLNSAVVFLLSIALAFLLAWRLSMLVARPLRELSDLTRSLSLDLDYSRRAPVHHADEVGRLATSFNGMLDRIERQQRELRETSGLLEAHVAGLEREIQERELAEQKLQISEEMLLQARKMEAVGKLAGGVAHDFNNILTAIRGYAELARMKLDPQSRTHHHLMEIQKAAERATSLTRQLLAFGRKQMLAPKIVDLTGIVERMQDMLKRLMGGSVEIVTEFDAAVGAVKVDPNQFEQVILNLVINARDAMPKGGRITLSLANAEIDRGTAARYPDLPAGQYVRLSVSDEGTGIDAATLPRIFEPFFTTKPEGQGTGLGLSTVYGIVKQSEGHVSVYSELGAGTVFHVYLPRAEGAVEPEVDVARAGLALRGSERILLIEDQEQVRNLAMDVLTEYGYQPTVAADGPEALRIWSQHAGRFDLVITDVMMPGMSGRDVIDRLIEQRPALRVLYMSGYSESMIVHRGVLREGIQFIQKPFTPQMLVERVRETLSARPPGAGSKAA